MNYIVVQHSAHVRASDRLSRRQALEDHNSVEAAQIGLHSSTQHYLLVYILFTIYFLDSLLQHAEELLLAKPSRLTERDVSYCVLSSLCVRAARPKCGPDCATAPKYLLSLFRVVDAVCPIEFGFCV